LLIDEEKVPSARSCFSLTKSKIIEIKLPQQIREMLLLSDSVSTFQFKKLFARQSDDKVQARILNELIH
jgi:hypothetical protein